MKGSGADSLCGGVIHQVVAPKKEKLAQAEAELAVQMEKLNAKRAQLKEVSYLVPEAAN